MKGMTMTEKMQISLMFPPVPERFVTFSKRLNRLSHVARPSSIGKGAEVRANEVDSTASGIVLPVSTKPCKLRGLAFKSLIGTILILGWGVINSTIFYVTGGREHVWLCFTQCNMDSKSCSYTSLSPKYC